MSYSLPTSHSLRRVLALTEQKDKLLGLITEIETEIAKALSSVAAPFSASPARKAPAKRKRRTARKSKGIRKGKPGTLKERILPLLHSAGAKGLRVKEIAAKLGLPDGNIFVWISTTGKPLVKKVQPGVYAVRSTAAPGTPARKIVNKPSKKVAKGSKK